jgi:hypothetical protein
MKRMFDIDDLVHIKPEQPECMRHFVKDKDAIVVECRHNDCQRGNEWEHSYALYIKGEGRVSWYHNYNLDLIEKDRRDLLEEWEREKEKEQKLHSDLNWIFANGGSVLHKASGATISALAACLDVNNLWGSHGEGFAYYQNAMAVLHLAEPYLRAGDKSGWIAFCKQKGKE